jgi:hypothetical protein
MDGILDIEKNTMSKEKNGVFHVGIGGNRYPKTYKFIGWTYSQPLSEYSILERYVKFHMTQQSQ